MAKVGLAALLLAAGVTPCLGTDSNDEMEEFMRQMFEPCFEACGASQEALDLMISMSTGQSGEMGMEEMCKLADLYQCAPDEDECSFMFEDVSDEDLEGMSQLAALCDSSAEPCDIPEDLELPENTSRSDVEGGLMMFAPCTSKCDGACDMLFAGFAELFERKDEDGPLDAKFLERWGCPLECVYTEDACAAVKGAIPTPEGYEFKCEANGEREGDIEKEGKKKEGGKPAADSSGSSRVGGALAVLFILYPLQLVKKMVA